MLIGKKVLLRVMVSELSVHGLLAALPLGLFGGSTSWQEHMLEQMVMITCWEAQRAGECKGMDPSIPFHAPLLELLHLGTTSQ